MMLELSIIGASRHDRRPERLKLGQALRGAPRLFAIGTPHLYRLRRALRMRKEAQILPLVGEQLEPDEDAQLRLTGKLEKLLIPVLSVGLGEGHAVEAKSRRALEHQTRVELATFGKVR